MKGSPLIRVVVLFNVASLSVTIETLGGLSGLVLITEFPYQYPVRRFAYFTAYDNTCVQMKHTHRHTRSLTPVSTEGSSYGRLLEFDQ
jgi:hypothetical protein